MSDTSAADRRTPSPHLKERRPYQKPSIEIVTVEIDQVMQTFAKATTDTCQGPIGS